MTPSEIVTNVSMQPYMVVSMLLQVTDEKYVFVMQLDESKKFLHNKGDR